MKTLTSGRPLVSFERLVTLTRMRSTLIIDDHLFKQARQRAADLGTTLSDVVNQALREALAKPKAKAAAKFSMITFGGPAGSQRHEPADFAEAAEADDERSLGRSR
jgi:hypothetical protein